MSSKAIERLLQFGLQNGMLERLDVPQVRNQIMEIMQESEIYEGELCEEKLDSPLPVLGELLNEAVAKGIIEDGLTDRDLLDAKIMAQLMPRQSELYRKFEQIRCEKGVEAATDFYYKLSKDSNYIHMDRINKNIVWKSQTEYGNLEITINLSKPEKDPKDIARARNVQSTNYPKCLLCLENVGFPGTLNHPARSNHRVLPLNLNGEEWYFQYSPYVYYNEHAIIFKGAHEPMKISRNTFTRLLDFVDQFPHYFLGSNADLPIVGGSILSHDHFQGGHHVFPMAVATAIREYKHADYANISIQMVKWPLSVIRLQGNDKKRLEDLSVYVLESWRKYSDEQSEILAFSSGDCGGSNGSDHAGVGTCAIPHNTITPIARVNGKGMFEVDLVLRNNRQSEQHPDGIFHPHQHLHHIKKENIGLIEVMGLAVLPARLKDELKLVEDVLTGQTCKDQLPEHMSQHLPWIGELELKYGTGLEATAAAECIRQEVSNKFSKVLECSGVFKMTEAGISAFDKFIRSLGCI